MVKKIWTKENLDILFRVSFGLVITGGFICTLFFLPEKIKRINVKTRYEFAPQENFDRGRYFENKVLINPVEKVEK